MSFLLSMATAFILRVVSFYIGFKRSGWIAVKGNVLLIVALFSLVLGILVPAGNFDIMGIFIRMLVVAAIIMVFMNEDITDAISITITAAVVQIVISFLLQIFAPFLIEGLSPFTVP